MSSLPIDTHRLQETDHPDITQNVLSFYCQKHMKEEIPMDVITIIKLFWTMGKIWSLHKSIIDSIYNIKHGQRYKLSRIKTHGAIFGCNLFRDGLYLYYQLCAISIPIHPIHIEEIRIYFELSCITTKVKFQGTKLFKNKYEKEMEASNKWQSKPLNVLQFELCKHSQIQFQCFVDVLQIKYKHNNDKYLDYYKPLKLRKNIEYFFKKRCLKKRGFEIGDHIISEPFGGGANIENVDNHCYWLIIQVLKNDLIRVKLRLFRLPHNFNKIQIVSRIESIGGTKRISEWKQNCNFRAGHQLSFGNIEYKNLSKVIKFKIRISIANCWNDYEKLIRNEIKHDVFNLNQ